MKNILIPIVHIELGQGGKKPKKTFSANVSSKKVGTKGR
jgi:hypothetical protein